MKRDIKKQTSVCECGAELDFVKTPFMTAEQRICPNCGRKHYTEIPIDWRKVMKPLVDKKNQKM